MRRPKREPSNAKYRAFFEQVMRAEAESKREVTQRLFSTYSATLDRRVHELLKGPVDAWTKEDVEYLRVIIAEHFRPAYLEWVDASARLLQTHCETLPAHDPLAAEIEETFEAVRQASKNPLTFRVTDRMKELLEKAKSKMQ